MDVGVLVKLTPLLMFDAWLMKFLEFQKCGNLLEEKLEENLEEKHKVNCDRLQEWFLSFVPVLNDAKAQIDFPVK